MKTVIKKKKNTPLTFAFVLLNRTEEASSVTPETRLKNHSPLQPVKTNFFFLIPSSKMDEAAGFTTSPMDLSDQE